MDSAGRKIRRQAPRLLHAQRRRNNIALALFTFDSLAAYEIYRQRSFADQECLAAFKYAETTGCIISYERSFFRPVFS